MNTGKLRGAWGEAVAGEYLRKKRYKIEAAGYSCRFGEIDIIASNRKFLVFVEVKLRKDSAMAEAREFVTPAKQRKVRTAAMYYLMENPTEKQPRFDVMEVYAPQGQETRRPVIRHWPNAF